MDRKFFVFSHKRDDFYEEVVSYLKSIDSFTQQPKEADFSIVLGGDGTVLAAAREVNDCPLLAINTGHLGFLTTSSKDCYTKTIVDVLNGKYSTTTRTLLDVSLPDEAPMNALNDIVIHPNAPNGIPKLIKLAVYVKLAGHKKLNLLSEYRASGLIVSTPTGSTAFNLSSSGPIIHPDCHSLVVTPICPQGLTQRPIVLPGDYTIVIEPLEDDLYVCVDGQFVKRLERNNLTVKYSSHKIFTVNPQSTYFEVLGEKLSWGHRPV